ncbi:hypothetical protein H5410_001401 [Solanum commersonii]|uniref:Uncharacterized protein n=1 Tax=Solanum commersonii TaxID=4109 RepID=A0A9J6AZ19_SOLCO|nr:hypothetical protein H5410_001401 [Solanum commersonii]
MSSSLIFLFFDNCKCQDASENTYQEISLRTFKRKKSQRNMQVSHCFREGKGVADSLAKFVTAIQDAINL